MAIPFLDVIAFRATVNEEAETLDVLLWLRDIPEMAERRQVTNMIEYSWIVNIYLSACYHRVPCRPRPIRQNQEKLELRR